MDEDNPATNTQEPGEYQPDIIDHSALQQIEGAEMTAQISSPAPVAAPTVQAQSPNIAPTVQQTETAAPQKSHRGLKIALIVIASLLVVAAIGLALFYFVIRTPDSAYDEAIQNLQTMKTSAEAIRDRKLIDIPTIDLEISQYNSIKKDATTYVNALAKFRANAVLAKDTSVMLVYAKNKSLVEPYGQSTVDMVNTTLTYQNVHTTCSSALRTLFASTQNLTRPILDSSSSKCQSLLTTNPTVPTKAFNDTVYTKYVAAVQQIISALGRYIDAKASGDSFTVGDAATDVNQGVFAYSDVDNIPATISNTAQPSDKISDIIKVVQQQKNVFFRR